MRKAEGWDDIHNPGEMNGQIRTLKEHVKAR